ncbi:MAG: hypothetical protein IK990_11415 [Ruminiclostridium sp.]|nr:hypothetical protein [Ruminiclostridium sp.]
MTTIKVSKIYDALVEFCVQQSNGRVGIERINAVVADGLRMIMKCPSPRFYSEKVLSYTVIIDGKKWTNCSITICMTILLSALKVYGSVHSL